MPVQRPSGSVDASTQLYMKIAEIHDDTVVLKNGGLRAVLDVTTMNLSLKSEQEQNAIVGSYQEFLNVLDFPIQILIRSKRKDVDGYLENMIGLARKQQDPLMRDQTYNYINFISSLVKNQAIMEKRFYVVVPYDPPRAKTNFFSNFMSQLNPADSLVDARIRSREFESLSKSVRARINVVAGALGRIGLATKRLSTNELIELFYQYYNPSTSETQKLHHLNESNLKKIDIALEEQLRLTNIKPVTSMPDKQPAQN
jgi:hypothetical protein